MLKTLLVYILVIGGIAVMTGISGATHITEQAMQRWEHTK